MKEAAGEANMTVITIVLIGVVAAVGLILVPRLMKTIRKNTCCTDAGGKMVNVSGGTTCTAASDDSTLFNKSQYNSCYNATETK